jgi:hypothetical protein
MSDRFSFDDAFYPVPPAAVDADPAATIRDLLFRVARLEQSLEEHRLQALADMREILLELISLRDDITTIVERWGVTSNAREAAMVRSIVALGKKMIDILKHHQVEAINTIGEPFDPETSEMVRTEVREEAAPQVVLREVRAGYRWPHGILRRAQVVVNAPPEAKTAPAPNPPARGADDATIIGSGAAAQDS